MQIGLSGEHARYFDKSASLLDWKTVSDTGVLNWHKLTFHNPENEHPLMLDLGSMGKGIAWVNGHCIGHYWLIAGDGDDDMDDPIIYENKGEPTQRYYHIPLEWLNDNNSLVLFEEQGGDPSKIRILNRK